MDLQLRHSIPFVTIQLTYQGHTIDVSDVLVDTGSGATVISADIAIDIGISPQPSDNIRTIQGVGGIEVVYERQIDSVQIGQWRTDNLIVEISGMDYGFTINGILGMDVLLQSGALIDLRLLQLNFSEGEY